MGTQLSLAERASDLAQQSLDLIDVSATRAYPLMVAAMLAAIAAQDEALRAMGVRP